jgi:hypothetical protein
MIFAHAPIVFPAVTGRALPFRHVFYAHVLLLHLSLIARISADLAGSLPGLHWSSLGNAAALVLFLVNNAYGMITGHHAAKGSQIEAASPFC